MRESIVKDLYAFEIAYNRSIRDLSDISSSKSRNIAFSAPPSSGYQTEGILLSLSVREDIF